MPPDDTAEVPVVEVRRSRRRARTVSAWREGGRTIVAIPARFTRAQEREWVGRMVERLAAQERRRRPSDVQLVARATELSRRYLAGRAVPTSVRWSSNQGRRWGSCTPAEGTIRISDRVQGMPRWVLDYVLLHELAHLLQPGHGEAFWAELAGYPHTQRARGFLEGYAFARDGAEDGDVPDEPVDDDVSVDEL
nr:M48 family metallopeptidase [Cellulomonas avistercoris]